MSGCWPHSGPLTGRLGPAYEPRYGQTFSKKNDYTYHRLRRSTKANQNPVSYADGLARWQILLTLWVCGLIDLYFADETGFTQQPYVPYGWQKKHQPRLLPARTTTKRLNLLGLLRLDNHLTIYHSEKPLTGAFVVESRTHFVTRPRPKPLVIVLDNGPIHRCQLVYDRQAEWEEQDVYLFFLPAYSPHLNPIEILWRMMKYRWLTKVNYLSWGRLKKAIFAIIKAFGQDYRIDFTDLQTKNIIQFNSA